jgi:hypothetical protein
MRSSGSEKNWAGGFCEFSSTKMALGLPAQQNVGCGLRA